MRNISALFLVVCLAFTLHKSDLTRKIDTSETAIHILKKEVLQNSEFEILPLDSGKFPDTLIAHYGGTPTLDGFIHEEEYTDTRKYTGVNGWNSDTPPASENKEDLSVVFFY